MMLVPTSPPRGVFEGVNFMTPNIEGYYRLRAGYAELSSGTGMKDEPIYGVTVRPDPAPRRSKMFHSKTDAINYIRSMS